jgi:hypothetical protein
MKLAHSLTLAFSLCALPALAEVVQLQDGRSVDLKDDGTYAFVETEAPSGDAYVEFQESFFTHHVGEYNQNSIRFMPVFKNVSDKKIVGMKFTATFKNPFGEEVVVFTGDSDEQVRPGTTSTHKLFYVIEDNPFIAGETYDKLLTMVQNDNGSIDLKATMIALDGGEIIDLSQ